MWRLARRSAWRLLWVAALGISSNGCTTIEPWQRGTLAKAHMAPAPHPLHNSLRNHVQNSREAASGGDGAAAGGGCGCY